MSRRGRGALPRHRRTGRGHLRRHRADCLIGYLLPVLAGNIVGGVELVSMLNHAQV